MYVVLGFCLQIAKFIWYLFTFVTATETARETPVALRNSRSKQNLARALAPGSFELAWSTRLESPLALLSPFVFTKRNTRKEGFYTLEYVKN